MTFDDTNQQLQGDSFTWPQLRPKPVDLNVLATAALVSVNGDREKAAPIFLRSLRAESISEYEYRVSVAMRNWAMEVIRASDKIKRESIIGLASEAAIDQPEQRKSRMTVPNQPLSTDSLRSAAYAWMDWPVLPGVLLRSATRAHLNAAAQDYFKKSNTMTRRANWLSAIAEKLEDDTTKVAAVMEEKDVAALALKHKVTTN